jgi:Cu-processing system ATP-binding protein
MIQARHVSKSFGAIQVLRAIDIDIPRGEVTAIIGPNASGKTTFNRILLGLVQPDAGEILLDGLPIVGQSAYRERVGYMQQAARFPENLCAADVFEMIGNLRGASRRRDEELIEALGVGAILRTPFRNLSGGTRQRVNAALAFLFQPELLVLDEPTAALDPVSSSILKDKIRTERAKGRTFILTSHVLHELEELADRIVFLLDGMVRFAGHPQDLLRATGEKDLERAVATLMWTWNISRSEAA